MESSVRILFFLLYLPAAESGGTVVNLVQAAEVARSVVNRKRRPALDGRNPGDLPPAKGLTIDTVVPSEQAMARSHRQIDYIDEYRAVADVEVRRAVFHTQVARVGNAARLTTRQRPGRAVIQRLAQRVGGLQESSAASLILAREHQAVIIRSRDVLAHVDTGERRVRENLQIGSLRAPFGRVGYGDVRLILVDVEQELVTARSLIIGLHGKVVPE